MKARVEHTQPTGDAEILLLLGATGAPFALWLPLWVSLGFFLLLGIRALSARSGRPLPSRFWRVLLALAVLAAVILSFGSPFGLRSGTALFLLMLGVKAFEQTTARDRKVTVLLCCFLLLAGTLYSRSLPLFLYDLLLLAAVFSVLQRLQRPSAAPAAVLARTGRILAQALPLAVILFLLFPRVGGGLLSLSPSSQTAYTGLSRSMSPGDVAHLAPSEEVAFRVKFHKRPETRGSLYWRALVLTRYDGDAWRPVENPSAPAPEVEPRGKIAEYSVDLSPTGRKYLPALDLPLEAPEEARLRRGFVLRREEKVTSGVRYRLASAPRYRTGRPREDILEAALAIEERANPRARSLAERLRQRTSGPRELVEALLERFAEGDYRYTRNPPLLREEAPVDHFLFGTKQGFCGHYAQALAWTARAAGVPARVVTGYLGGERNPLGAYWILRQSDAHAWVEVWFPDAGWVRKDPTRHLSPDQILSDGEGDASAEEISGEGDHSGPVRGILRYAGLAWDAVHFGWSYYVLGFTAQRQLELLAGLRLGDTLERALPRAMLLLTFLFLLFPLILAACLVKEHRETSRLDRAYRRFRKKLARAGIPVSRSEGPLDLALRIERQRPDLAPSCRRILTLYAELRYAERGDPHALRRLCRSVRRFRPSARIAS